MFNSQFTFFAVAVPIALALAGCSDGQPSIEAPAINAGGAGRQAMQRYDANRDGRVSGDELDGAPALKAALGSLDANGDGGVTADEVADRVGAWQASQLGRMSITCDVILDGKPLSDATVTFVPEEFLGDEIQAARGVTDARGSAAMSIPDLFPPGVACGLYRVEISKLADGEETIPAEYNSQTTLGVEVAEDAGAGEGMVQFDLP
jgi:hypothetical protein